MAGSRGSEVCEHVCKPVSANFTPYIQSAAGPLVMFILKHAKHPSVDWKVPSFHYRCSREI